MPKPTAITTRRRVALAMGAAVLMAATPTLNGFSSTPTTSSRKSKPMGATRVGSSSVTASSTGNCTPSSPLGMIIDERQEFELKLGKAMDTLRQDYPYLLEHAPDYSIYDNDLEIIDPAGVKLHGLRNYRNAFYLVHTVMNLFYCKERSSLTFRLVYDWARNNIRVSWNAEVVPKAIFGGTKTTLHVDGISVYEMSTGGSIVQHRIEHLLINDMPVAPERGIIHALSKEVIDPQSIPVFSKGGSVGGGGGVIAKFQQWNPMNRGGSLFSKMQDEQSSSSSSSLQQAMEASNGATTPDEQFDNEAFARKNKTRKKFGLKELTPEEFLETEAQIRQMEMQEKQRQSAMATTDAANLAKKEEKRGGFLNKLFGDILEDECESNFDCVRPEICCDFGFKKMCCSSGVMVGHSQMDPKGEMATVPVPAGVDYPKPPADNGRYY